MAQTFIATGSTHRHRDALKRNGWVWNPGGARWELPADGRDWSDREVQAIVALDDVEVELLDGSADEGEDDEADVDLFV